MTNINDDDLKKIQEIANYYSDILYNLLEKGNDPLLVAAILVQQGLSIYKTVLNNDDYDMMCEEIYNTSDDVTPFVTEKTITNYMN